jgi:hypothetical protein
MTTDAAWAIWAVGVFMLTFPVMVAWVHEGTKAARIWTTAILVVWTLPVLLRAYLMVLAS